MSVTIVEPPACEPVDVRDAGRHLNTIFEDDKIVEQKVRAARQYLERFLGVAFITQTLRASFNEFSHPLRLPRWPVQEIVAVSYHDAAWGVRVAAPSSYVGHLLETEGPAFLVPATNSVWPATARIHGAVEVTFRAGFGDEPEDVPETLREAIRQLAGHFYENREATFNGNAALTELPFGVGDLVSDFRTWTF